MKKLHFILFLVLISGSIRAQINFRTIVPQTAIVEGESFQVQYILEDAENPGNLEAPTFKGFRIVTGPNTYTGSSNGFDGVKHLRNAVFTLEAIRPGSYIIPGATVIIDGKKLKSNKAMVEVISIAEARKRYMQQMSNAQNSEYFLRPGEDPYQKINKNLYVKVVVDRNNCVVGEPVVATFKLYSRLESKSDIIKNPGFYGFTVHDMVSLNDHQSTTETIEGKPFDVHTIRKVQLYPLGAGQFSIDPMEIKNQVEFSRSTVNKKTEQEITEGVLGNDFDNEPEKDGELFETTIITKSIAINVKPVPSRNRPDSFSGATGNFLISANLRSDHLKRNEEGQLVITVTGKGNFTQLNAPVIDWPDSIEGFEPHVSDELDKDEVPLKGTRTFVYPFVSVRPGEYTIPEIKFSYFDPSSGSFKQANTTALKFIISQEQSKQDLPQRTKDPVVNSRSSFAIWLSAAMITILISLIAYGVYKKTSIARQKKNQSIIEPETKIPGVEYYLKAASLYVQADDKIFYTALNQGIWNFFRENLELSGSDQSKFRLETQLRNKGISRELAENAIRILQLSEVAGFTDASMNQDKTAIFEMTRKLLEEIREKLL